MLSRRQFLGTMLGLAAAGAIGVEASNHPNALHRIGLQNSPDLHVPDAGVRIQAGVLRSNHARDAAWSLSVPEQGAQATVFCLHGRNGSNRSVFDELRLQDIVASAGLPLAIASVDGGNSYWHPRRDGTDTLAMLLDDFVPLIDARTGTGVRSLYGWSMGGFGALLAMATAPGMFQGVSVISPALWTTAGASAPGAFDDAADFHRHDVFAKRDVLATKAVHVSCGDGDPFRKASAAFVAGLPTAATAFGAGFHDGAYFRHASPVALQFLASHS